MCMNVIVRSESELATEYLASSKRSNEDISITSGDQYKRSNQQISCKKIHCFILIGESVCKSFNRVDLTVFL